MSEITDEALASIYSSLSSCSPLVRGLAERLRRVEKERDKMKEALLCVTDCQGASCCDQSKTVYEIAQDALGGLQ